MCVCVLVCAYCITLTFVANVPLSLFTLSSYLTLSLLQSSPSLPPRPPNPSSLPPSSSSSTASSSSSHSSSHSSSLPSSSSLSPSSLSQPAPSLSSPSPRANHFVCKWDFHASKATEVSVCVGERVEVTDMSNPDWWYVRTLSRGNVNCVQILVLCVNFKLFD